MSFDRVAPHYRWLETIAFGHQLQRARTAFVRQLDAPRRVLVVGEGNGRFLAALLRVHRALQIDCIEASARMIELARERAGVEQVNFIRANVNDVVLQRDTYDLIVTHFFLDCFDEKTLPPLIEKFARAATADTRWLIADFHAPPRGWPRLRARFLIAVMYFFFRAVAGIEARRLVDYRPLLRLRGFDLTKDTVSPNGMIRSELWERR